MSGDFCGQEVDTKDLLSIQEARELVNKACRAWQVLKGFDQAKTDRIVAAMAEAGYKESRRLAEMAVEETQLGIVGDKIQKNQFATRNVHEYIKGLATAGLIREDRDHMVTEYAEPVGVIAGIIPTTNPTSTVMYKALIALKARNTIIFSPHPRAVKCSLEAAGIMEKAAVTAGAPPGSVVCLATCTREGTSELMRHPEVALILATGGSAMVKAAYSAGKPAYGVGPGNVPVFIERTAEIPEAVQKILAGKTFDNGTVCSSEQAVITEEVIAGRVLEELQRQGAHLVPEKDIPALERTVCTSSGGINPNIVGRSACFIAETAGITVPALTRALVARLPGVGKQFPLSGEKLCPVLAFYVEKDWERACERCIELLHFGGLGHTLVLHSRNEEVIREFALKKPVFRILVNTPASQGAIGLTTGLPPALTLGCGTWGGNITADNVGPLHLINIKRLAYHLSPAGGTKPAGNGGYRYTRKEVAEAVENFLAVKNR